MMNTILITLSGLLFFVLFLMYEKIPGYKSYKNMPYEPWWRIDYWKSGNVPPGVPRTLRAAVWLNTRGRAEKENNKFILFSKMRKAYFMKKHKMSADEIGRKLGASKKIAEKLISESHKYPEKEIRKFPITDPEIYSISLLSLFILAVLLFISGAGFA